MDLVQELLNVQAKYGELTAANVLKAAKFKKSPLHNCFDSVSYTHLRAHET